MAQLIRGVFCLDISFICWFRVFSFVFCVFCSLISWISWSKRQGVRVPTMVMYRYFWRPFWTCTWGLPLLLMKLCSHKSRTPSFGPTFIKCWIKLLYYWGDEIKEDKMVGGMWYTWEKKFRQAHAWKEKPEWKNQLGRLRCWQDDSITKQIAHIFVCV